MIPFQSPAFPAGIYINLNQCLSYLCMILLYILPFHSCGSFRSWFFSMGFLCFFPTCGRFPTSFSPFSPSVKSRSREEWHHRSIEAEATEATEAAKALLIGNPVEYTQCNFDKSGITYQPLITPYGAIALNPYHSCGSVIWVTTVTPNH